jgi:RNA polymerase sigma-70 factor (ECF subfamily)
MNSSTDRARGPQHVADESRRPAVPSVPESHAEVAALFQRHGDFVFRVLKRLGTPAPDVEDALQEVFLVVARKLPEYEERGGMRAWLFTIARQVAQHARRSDERRERRERSLLSFRESDDPHAALERNQAAELVNRFLAELDPKQAEVFYLAEVEGLTAPEIAAALEIKLNTVYARLRLGRERFERALQRNTGRRSP